MLTFKMLTFKFVMSLIVLRDCDTTLENEDSAFDICSTKHETVFRSGFISSPGYPNGYPPYSGCTCEISVEDPGSQFLIKFIKSEIERSIECRKDHLEIFVDGIHVVTKCGDIPDNYNMTGSGHLLSMTFRADLETEERGFLTSIDSLGMMDIKCGLQSDLLPSSRTSNVDVINNRAVAMETEILEEGKKITDMTVYGGDQSSHLENDVMLPYMDDDVIDFSATITEAAMSEAGHADNTMIQSSSEIELSTMLSISVSIVLLSAALLAFSLFGAWIRRRKRYTREISRASESNFLNLPVSGKNLEINHQAESKNTEKEIEPSRSEAKRDDTEPRKSGTNENMLQVTKDVEVNMDGSLVHEKPGQSTSDKIKNTN